MPIRLDRYLSNNGSLSRSEAQRTIRSGSVVVNGARVADPAHKIEAVDRVVCEGVELGMRAKRYFMLNKPVDVVCVTYDGMHKTVLDLLPAREREGLHPAGRLDRDTTGLVLLTDDGDWSHRVTSPRSQCTKVYRVGLSEGLSSEASLSLERGVQLHGERGPTLPAEVERLGDREIRLAIHEGKYHQVKRMLAAVGNRVVSLHRERIGGIVLDPALAPGGFRSLTQGEVVSVGIREQYTC